MSKIGGWSGMYEKAMALKLSDNVLIAAMDAALRQALPDDMSIKHSKGEGWIIRAPKDVKGVFCLTEKAVLKNGIQAEYRKAIDWSMS